MNQVPAKVRLPVIQRNGGKPFIERLEKLGLADVHFTDAGETDVSEVGIPRTSGRELADLGHSHLVVVALRIAQLDAGPGRLRNLRFHGEYRAGLCGGLIGSVPSQLQHFRDVLLILLEKLLRVIVLFEVVVAVGKAQTALPGDSNHLVAILLILRGTKTKERADTFGVGSRHLVLKLRETRKTGNAG